MSWIFYYPFTKVGIFVELFIIYFKTIIFDANCQMAINLSYMNEDKIEHSIIRKQIQDVLPYISLSAIASDYFNKTRQWFYQRLNETKVNGKTIKFTEKELVTLSNVLAEIGAKMQDVSKILLPATKKIKSLILDMDLTILDRGIAGDYYSKRENIYDYCKKVHLFTMYDGWEDVFSFIRKNNIRVAIISDAHDLIINTVIAYFDIPCNCVVGHFAAQNKKKPNPFPMLEALRLINEVPETVLSFGDSLNDYLAATSANIQHYGCLWASKDEAALRENGCGNFINCPQQIIEILNR